MRRLGVVAVALVAAGSAAAQRTDWHIWIDRYQTCAPALLSPAEMIEREREVNGRRHIEAWEERVMPSGVEVVVIRAHALPGGTHYYFRSAIDCQVGVTALRLRSSAGVPERWR